MPVYNAERFVGNAIKSILNQTYKNLELIIIEDASTDNSLSQIQAFNDNRIQIIRNDRNRGIVYSRNKGLCMASGEFIGMFDADDIAYSNKFEEQITFLEQNKDYGMVGSWANFIDEDDQAIKGAWKLNSSPAKIPSIMLFKNYFLQSAVLYRKDCIKSYSFKEGFDILEDYLIWLEIIKKHKAWNLQKPLVHYRIHQNGVTKRKRDEMIQKEKKVFRLQLQELDIDPTDQDLNLHLLIKNNEAITNIKTLKAIERWLLKIINQNERTGVYEHQLLIRVIVNRWLKVCTKASRFHLNAAYQFLSSRMIFLLLKSYTI